MKQDKHRSLVMVVDDDPDSLSVLVRHIRREGLTVVEASSGSECLHIVKQHRPDVILLDLMMPEMDGFTLCRALRADSATAEIPIILLTACDDVETRAEGMELGISDFIAKPVSRRGGADSCPVGYARRRSRQLRHARPARPPQAPPQG